MFSARDSRSQRVEGFFQGGMEAVVRDSGYSSLRQSPGLRSLNREAIMPTPPNRLIELKLLFSNFPVIVQRLTDLPDDRRKASLQEFGARGLERSLGTRLCLRRTGRWRTSALAHQYLWRNGGPKGLTMGVNPPVPNRGSNPMVRALLSLVHLGWGC